MTEASRTAQSESRIAFLKIENFRGIPQRLEIDLTTPNSAGPGSLLLVGDNGTGKSSIADAFEFVLQARIGRDRSLVRPDVSSPRSFAVSGNPQVTANLSDGSTVFRAIMYGGGGAPTISPADAHPEFAFAAFVLRRSDILRFNDTSENERQLMFADYVGGRKKGSWAGSSVDQKERLEAERLEAKSAIQTELGALARSYKWEVSDSLLDEPAFDALLRKRLYGGMDPAKARERGMRIRLKPGTERKIESIRQLMKQYKRRVQGIRDTSKLGVDFVKSMSTLRKVLSGASANLTSAFRGISPAASFVERLEIDVSEGESFALRVRVHLANGTSCGPKQVFSEANQDLLALLVFLAVIEEAHVAGQAPVLVLDDVLQSIDQSVRVAVTEHLVTRLASWQFIITTHDRLWHAQLKSILQGARHPFTEREIVRWTFDEGPVVAGVRNDDAQLLREAMERGDVSAVCALAGVLNEAIADRLSWTLPTSITRRKGDMYTLGDLWPGIVKQLRKTTVGEKVMAVDRWIHLRNLAGAHYNEWARGLSRHEAHEYGRSVLGLLDILLCPACHRWIEKVGASDRWTCRCGGTVIM